MRGIAAALLALALLLPLAPMGPPAPARAELAMEDADRDRVSDDLEARLETLGPGERVRVIAVLEAPEPEPRRRFAGLGEFPVTHTFHLRPYGFAAELTRAQAERLLRERGVASLWLDVEVHTMMDTAAPSFGAVKARADFGVDGDGDGNATSYSKADAVICVIDTGIDAGHKDLDGGKVIGWRDFVNNKQQPYDDNGHGTHVAGTAAGSGDGNPSYKGVAPAAALVGVKVLDRNGSGSLSNVQAGVQWCVDNQAKFGIEIISMSLGTSQSSDGQDSLSQAINSAADGGILPIVAAGNSGPARFTVGSPAAAAKAVTVGAMIDTGERGFALAYFSSRGPTRDGREKPDIGAPGWAVTAPRAGTAQGYTSLSGTSMATPFTSGSAALLAAEGLNASEVKAALLDTAEDWGPGGKDIDYGAGRLRVYDAVKQGLGLTGQGPEEPGHQRASGKLSSPGMSVFVPFKVTDTRFPVALTLIIPNHSFGVPDLDLYLYAPGADTSRHQAALASGLSTLRQETIRVLPTATGRFVAEVFADSGTGDWQLDISAALLLDSEAPVTTLGLEGTRGNGGWYRGSVNATLTATDDAAGVFETWYRLDAAQSQMAVRYSGPFSIAGEGSHTIEYWSVDELGNTEAANTATVRIDAIAPVTSHAFSGPPGEAGWFRGTVNATLSASDVTSGIAATRWALDGGEEQGYEGPVAIAKDGLHTFGFRSEDNAGNLEAMREASVSVDATPPSTSIATQGTSGDNGWWRSAVALTLGARDATSGVARTEHRVDAGAWATSLLPFDVGADGTHDVEAFSVDVAGNQEAVQRATLRIDTLPPGTTAHLDGPAGARGWWRGPVTAALTATDATSGVARTLAGVDGAAESLATGPLALQGDGTHALRFRSVDVAGNEEPAKALEVPIDSTPPVTTPSFEGPAGLDGWFVGPVAVSLSASDATSGVAATTLTIDGASQSYQGPVTVAAEGVHGVGYASSDLAGNEEAPQAAELRIDATPPGSSLEVGQPSYEGPRRFVTSHTPLTLRGADALSGLRELRYRVDDGLWQVYEGPFTLPGPDGPRTVEFQAVDVAGNEEPPRTAELFVDDTAPQVAIASPRPGSLWVLYVNVAPLVAPEPGSPLDRVVVVQGALVRVRVEASDPSVGGDASGVGRVELWLGDALLVALGEEPYEWTWDTSKVPAGDHQLRAVAYDRVDNAAGAAVKVTVLGA